MLLSWKSIKINSQIIPKQILKYKRIIQTVKVRIFFNIYQTPNPFDLSVNNNSIFINFFQAENKYIV